MHLVAVYGSLKKGFYNHEALGVDAEFVGKYKVEGVMHLRWSYPTLSHFTEDDFVEGRVREHELEVYRIGDSAFDAITRMEVGAGYTPEPIETPYGEATIYYMEPEKVREDDVWIPAYTHDIITNKLF